jgi:hypothetical protein
MRIQPDVKTGNLKVTVGCHDKEEQSHIELSALQAATVITPGQAF